MTDIFNASNEFLWIVGLCVVEGREFTLDCAAQLRDIFAAEQADFVFKASFDKANRTSYASYRGPGIVDGLEILAEVRDQCGVRVLTDVHLPDQVSAVASVVDILQVPAFLCRQTDLVRAVAESGKVVNFKKGQFLSPYEMSKVISKARHFSMNKGLGQGRFIVCERGTFFGYNNLVVDMRGFEVMAKETKCPVLFDASHSTQLPGLMNEASGGQSEYVPALARAAVATGFVSGLYIETHPNPINALCDQQILTAFDKITRLIRDVNAIRSIVDHFTAGI